MPGGTIKVSDDGSRYVTSGGIGPMFANVYKYLLRIPGASGYGGYSTSTQVLSKWDGTGKVAIVTGAGGGLGFESARALASRGCEVIVTARDQAKADATVAKLKELLPGTPLLVPLPLDLSDLSSVKAFAEKFLALKKPLHILLNNAGVMALPKYTPTKDGHESQLGVNHFAHFVLTNLLLPHMIETAKSSDVEGRIVCTSSSAHHIPYKEGIRLQGYDDPSRYEAWGAYGQSKLANILFARELALRLKKQDAPVVAYALHPGGINTDLQRDMPILAKIFMLLARPLLKSIPQGAATQLFAATAPAGWAPSGEYLVDCNVAPSSAHSHNATLGVGLWNLTETVTGVKGAV